MRDTKFGQSFFGSTRGRVVTLLRRGTDTVEELSRRLELTDNAVRAHLATLERDGLVERRGIRRGARKPHFTYTLTHEAEHLFPKAYHVLLNQLLTVLKRRLGSKELKSILREVAHALAVGKTSSRRRESIESRAARAIEALEAIGGTPRLERGKNILLMRSGSGCPFADAVAQHPEVCQMAEALLSEITGLEVRKRCTLERSPQCFFEIEIRKGGSVQ